MSLSRLLVCHTRPVSVWFRQFFFKVNMYETWTVCVCMCVCVLMACMLGIVFLCVCEWVYDLWSADMSMLQQDVHCVCKSKKKCVHLCVHMHTHTCVHMQVCVCVCMHAFVCVKVNIRAVIAQWFYYQKLQHKEHISLYLHEHNTTVSKQNPNGSTCPPHTTLGWTCSANLESKEVIGSRSWKLGEERDYTQRYTHGCTWRTEPGPEDFFKWSPVTS